MRDQSWIKGSKHRENTRDCILLILADEIEAREFDSQKTAMNFDVQFVVNGRLHLDDNGGRHYLVADCAASGLLLDHGQPGQWHRTGDPLNEVKLGS